MSSTVVRSPDYPLLAALRLASPPIYPVLFAAGAIAWERRFAVRPLVAANRVFAVPIFECGLLRGS